MTVKIAALESKVKAKKVKLTGYDDAENMLADFTEQSRWKKEQGTEAIVVGPRNYDRLFNYIFLTEDRPYELVIKEVADKDPEDCMYLVSYDYDGQEVGRLEIRPSKVSSRYAK